MFRLELYITGRTPRLEAQVSELREILDRITRGHYTLEVIDVFNNPELAHKNAILATPTLIKARPLPVRRVVGDLRNHERVLDALEIESC